MSPPPVLYPGVYTIICEMENTSDPTIKWRNTYDFQCVTPPTNTSSLMDNVMHFQDSMTDDDSTFVEMRVYNWSKGANPYPTGLPLFVRTVNAPGDATAAWGRLSHVPAAGGEVCLNIARRASGAVKPGRFFFRSTIRDEDVQSLSGGKWTFTSIGAGLFTQTQLDSIVSLSGLSANLLGGTDANNKLVLVPYSKLHGTHGTAEPVANIVMVGVTTNKQTRKNKK